MRRSLLVPIALLVMVVALAVALTYHQIRSEGAAPSLRIEKDRPVQHRPILLDPAPV